MGPGGYKYNKKINRKSSDKNQRRFINETNRRQLLSTNIDPQMGIEGE